MKWTAVIVVGAVLAIAATYNSSFNDAVITGEGSITTNIGEWGFGPNANAALQVSRNMSGAGQGQGSALDVYAGDGGYLTRWYIDNPVVDGGRQVETLIDANGAIRTAAYEVISGVLAATPNNGWPITYYLPLSPTSDSSMLAIGSDLASGAAVYVSVCPSNLCNSGLGTAAANQAFVAMDGTSGVGNANVRFAIDGTDGTLRWTHSASNTYGGATWDTDIERVAAGILGSSVTQLQTPHLDQPAGKHDLAGTVVLTAAVSAAQAFGTSYTAVPVCTLTPTSDPGAGQRWWVTATAAAVTAHVSAAATITFDYHCVGNPN